MSYQINDVNNRRILFSPLNWGFGHVSRSIGLLDQLIDQRNTIIVACDNVQRKVYEEYFNSLEFIYHDGYPFEFSGKGNFAKDLWNSRARLKERMTKERDLVEQIVKELDIDIVLSDHRYGFRSDNVHSIFITHQYNLPVRFYEFMVQSYHKRLMSKFDSIWVMDDPSNFLTGKLSRNSDSNAIFIGHFSRFQRYSPIEKDIDSILIVSGPLVYGQQLVNECVDLNLDYIIGPTELIYPSNIPVISDSWLKQDEVIRRARKIVSRSGYSTIMDVATLSCEAQYFPTKGQREQEYLNNLQQSI